MVLLRFSNLRAGYGSGPDIVADAELALEEGETVAIVGPSGEGKSTLLKVVAGIVPPRSGTVEVLGNPWPAKPPAGSVGYVPQRLGLVRYASVLDNVLQGGLHETTWMQSLLHRAPDSVRARADEALARLGLADKSEVPVHALSGGQQRRVAVARALVQRPRLLLADEFLGELDQATMDIVIDAVKGQQRETRMGLLVVEHHLDQALRLADRVYRLKGGRLQPLERA